MNHAYPGPINHRGRKMSLRPSDDSKSARRTEPVFAIFSLSFPISDTRGRRFHRDEQIKHLTVCLSAVVVIVVQAHTVSNDTRCDAHGAYIGTPSYPYPSSDRSSTVASLLLGITMRSVLLILMQVIFNAILVLSHNNLRLHYQIPAR